MNLGYYAYFPSLLEPSPGPWGGHEIHSMHPVEAWKKILAWLESKDVDTLIAVVTPKYRDGMMHDWPFHYLCEFPEYPEARVFPPEVVRMNRAIVGDILGEEYPSLTGRPLPAPPLKGFRLRAES